MSTESALDNGNRSMLDTTLQMISQLGMAMKTHTEQEKVILTYIESLELKLKDAKQQHAQTKANIKSVRQSINQMKVVEQNLRCALSPIKRLPNDLLLHIFRFYVKEVDGARNKVAARWGKRNPAHQNCPSPLSWVCRRWMIIVASNSALRTTIEALIHHKSAEAQEQEQQRVDHAMQAGRSHERTLFMYHWKQQYDVYLKALIGSAAEWGSIHLSALEDPPASWDVGALRARDVTIYRNKIQTSTHFISLMRHASVLVLYGPPPDWGTLPWIRLKTFTIKNMARGMKVPETPLEFSGSHFIALLNAATELTDLTLDFHIGGGNDVVQELVRIEHRKLSCLSLHLRHFVAGRGPFGVALHAPNLQTLELISLRCSASVDDAPFVCSWDDPKVLRLKSMDDDEVTLAAELSKWLPNVHTLQAKGQNVDTLFVFFYTMLHYMPSQSLPLPLPKLSSLFIDNADVRGETLLEVLEGRLQHVRGNTEGISAVTEIKMYDSPGVTPSHWSRVQQLLDEGRRYGMEGGRNEENGKMLG